MAKKTSVTESTLAALALSADELTRLERVLREWGQTRDRNGHSMGPCARAAWDEAVRLADGLPRTKDSPPPLTADAWTDPYFYPAAAPSV